MRELVLGSWDDVAARLRDLRAAAGQPSYAALARRVRELRVDRDGPTADAPGRMTVYDCFRDGRQRMDLHLLADLGLALGLDPEQADRWERACFAVQNRMDATRIVSVSEQLHQTPTFVGRAEELTTVLRSPGQTWFISGLPGVGKTQVALRAGQALIHQGHAARLLVADLRGFHPSLPPADGEAMLDELVRTLTGSLTSRLMSPTARREVLAQAALDHRVVLLLDDAADEEQVQSIVGEGLPGVSVLITSRRRLRLSDVEHLDLTGLGEDDSMALLSAVVTDGRLAEDPAAAREIVARTGGHPLALDLAARQVAGTTWALADHLHLLARHAARLHLPEPVDELLALSVRELSPSADRALRAVAGELCTSLAPDAVAALLGGDATAELAELEAASLIRDEGGRITLHDLVRVHAARRGEELDSSSERAEATGRLLDHYETRVRQALTSLGPGVLPRVSPDSFTPLPGGPDHDAAREWLVQERENLQLLTDPELSAVRPGFVPALSAALSNWYDSAGWFSDAVQVHRRSLAMAERRGDVRSAAEAAGLLGAALVRLGDPEGEEVVTAALENPAIDPYAKVSALTSLAVLKNSQGDLHRTLDLCLAALDLVERGEVQRPRANLIGNIGVVAFRLGRHDEAARHHRAAYDAAVAEDDRVMAAVALANLSPLLLDTDPRAAVKAARESADISRREGASLVLPNALTNLGLALTRLGEHTEALDEQRKALAIAMEIGDRYMTADILNNLAESLAEAGDQATSHSTAEEALDLARDLDDLHVIGRAHELLARTAVREAAAAQHLADALAAFSEGGFEADVERVRQRLGRTD